MSEQLGGKVSPSSHREFGHADIKIESNSRLLEGIEHSAEQKVWMSHGDKVSKLPKGFKKIGSSINSPIAAFENTKLKKYGFQFHPESIATEFGKKLLKNFLEEY